MFERKGFPVMPGIAVREAVVLDDAEEFQIHRRYTTSDGVPTEIERFERAVAAAVQEMDREIVRLAGEGKIPTQILEFHRALILSPEIDREVREEIHAWRATAEYAVHRVLRKWCERFDKMEDRVIRERRHDIIDVERRLLRDLLGSRIRGLRDLDREVVIIAHTLTPSQTATLDRDRVKGFATDVGGVTSHTAIMARALGIPAVVGLRTISQDVVTGDTVIVDGIRGVVIVSPDEATVEEFRLKEKTAREVYRALLQETELPAETIDGHEITLSANIEHPEEAQTAKAMGAAGVGLFRTEFLFEDMTVPSEEQQIRAYRDAIEAMGAGYVVIRTMDIGADKLAGDGTVWHERNPFLGCRSIRLSFARPELFRTQIRAILQASAHGDVRLLFPMISTLDELRRAKAVVEDVRAELRQQGIAFDAEIPVGIMVEVPSTALTADQFAREVDFFSIGTNDLVQYTLAVDRVNERVAHLYQPASPSVLRLIQHVIDAGRDAGIEVSLCGEMSGDPKFALLLLGLGLRQFSISPPGIPFVKRVIRSVTLAEAEAVADAALQHSDPVECARFLEERARSLVPQVL
ncbi:MAG: phosphoenolpyruvate--protein phosphotransferase [Planctomycetes bacterium]|nr:phosphoenolpyruvate--protein phosphotransferase [Planctomycetota bacterium]